MHIGAIVITATALMLSGGAMADEQLEMGKAVYMESVPSCSVCHTLNNAGSAGQIGPNLDSIAPTADRVYSAVTQGVGIMPSFSESLTEEQRRAVAYYVSQVAGQ